jgi:hypothetical protein
LIGRGCVGFRRGRMGSNTIIPVNTLQDCVVEGGRRAIEDHLAVLRRVYGDEAVEGGGPVADGGEEILGR